MIEIHTQVEQGSQMPVDKSRSVQQPRVWRPATFLEWCQNLYAIYSGKGPLFMRGHVEHSIQAVEDTRAGRRKLDRMVQEITACPVRACLEEGSPPGPAADYGR